MNWSELGSGLLLTAVLLACNAFFVGAEFALIGARRSIIEPKAQEGGRAAKMTLWAIENVSFMMAAAQMGITVFSLLLGAVSEPMIAHAIEGPFASLGIPTNLVHPVAVAITLAFITYLHVVLGEMVPKNIAIAGPEKTALVLGPILVVIAMIFKPILWTFNGIGNSILRLMRVEPANEVATVFTRDEVADLVEESQDGGMISEEDEQLLLSALTFESRSVENIVIPMDKMRTLEAGFTASRAEEVALAGFSRFPVVGADGVPFGYVHIKDFLDTPEHERDLPVSSDIVRAMPVLSITDSLQAVLGRMQREGAHLALVASENGVAGVITLEDVLEELVGQIRDDSRAARK
ncbi:hemolysin family protein [Timonella senegalensis]|uniref:hemolysin family protein n=1 Tax=Timonella senegalensis TaxID=1465825 RepID=UPI002FDE3F6F